jgi:predicted nucleic acid-binding protein
MIVLDTNVLSALMRANLEPAVMAWLNTQPPSSVWTTTVSLFEIEFGLSTMPTGAKQRALKQAFADVVQYDLNNRILGFDAAAAQQAGDCITAPSDRPSRCNPRFDDRGRCGGP